MPNRFFDIVFTPTVQAEQLRHGSRAAYAKATRLAGKPGLSDAERAFISARDSFYLATVSETGWPHIQHRGGPRGFVRFVAPDTLAWADYAGNRQYVSIGNARTEARVAMFFMDYPAQRRLKLLGRMSTFEIETAPGLEAALRAAGDQTRMEHAIAVDVEAFDWNCPQHITPRYTVEEIDASLAPLSVADWTRDMRAAEG